MMDERELQAAALTAAVDQLEALKRDMAVQYARTDARIKTLRRLSRAATACKRTSYSLGALAGLLFVATVGAVMAGLLTVWPAWGSFAFAGTILAAALLAELPKVLEKKALALHLEDTAEWARIP